jgi:hypothetical protein
VQPVLSLFELHTRKLVCPCPQVCFGSSDVATVVHLKRGMNGKPYLGVTVDTISQDLGRLPSPSFDWFSLCQFLLFTGNIITPIPMKRKFARIWDLVYD